MTDTTFDDWLLRAQAGDLLAVEWLLKQCQPRVYALSRRMLNNAADAEDAAQEVLLKIATSLQSFRGESEFLTWAHRIAVNHLLSLLRSDKSEAQRFDALSRNLEMGLQYGADRVVSGADEQLLAYEVFVECAQRMLHCLDASNRLALVLVDVCDLSHDEAAAVLDIQADALRQRLSRARKQLSDYLLDRCGLCNPRNACHCAKQVPAALAAGSIHRDRVRTDAPGIESVQKGLRDLRELALATRLIRQLPEPLTPPELVGRVRQLLATERFRPLH